MYWHRNTDLESQALPGFFVFRGSRRDPPDHPAQPGFPPARTFFLSNLSKSRQKAEQAFLKTQSQSLARNRILTENEGIEAARNEKTNRLRELRMAKEAADRAAAAPAEGDM
jgi:hypothetical protein